MRTDLVPGTIDTAAVEGIRQDRIDWRHKGMPDFVSGMTISATADLRLRLFSDGFLPPLLTLDRAALDHNLDTMARWCASRGLALAPHGKTTMAPQLFARQFEHGAWGLTTATASQLRVYRAFGVSRIVMANELLDPTALRWLASELERDPSFEFCCWVDSERGVALMTEALRTASRPVDVVVEVGATGGRAGVRDLATGVAVAEAVAASPALRLTGVGGYEGALGYGSSADTQAGVVDYLRVLRELTVQLSGRGLFDGLDRVLVSAGGSAWFDLVADVLTEPWPDGLPVLPVVRSGAYLTHDDGVYQDVSPLGSAARIPGMPAFRPALLAWAQVTSHPADDLALLTIGRRDLSFDAGMPLPRLRRTGGVTMPLTGCQVTKLNDQHAYLAIDPGTEIAVGDWIGLGISHPCTVFDKWQLIPELDADGETVVDLVRTYF